MTEGKKAIVAELAKARCVEEMLEKISGQALTGNLLDLAQDVYLILLEYDDEKIADLYAHDQIKFFIARILTNQYRSATSPFFLTYRRPEDHAPLFENLAVDTDGGYLTYTPTTSTTHE